MTPADNGRPLLGTFWGGGFDSIAPLARMVGDEQRIDLVAATGHDRRAEEDYRLLARLGLGWSREDVRWHLCEPEPGRYTFEHLEPIVRAAQQHRVEVVWSWMHYGCPSFVDPLGEAFPERLAALGFAHLAWLREQGVEASAIAPINELSYFTWHVAELGSWYPFSRGRGKQLKDRLVAAHRHCFEQIKAVSPETLVLLIEPLYYAVGTEGDPGSVAEAAYWRRAALEATDQLLDCTDVLGLNFYAGGQVECYRPSGNRRYRRRMLGLEDPRRLSLLETLRLFWDRYEKPVIVTETSVRAGRRLPWLTHLTDQAVMAVSEGLPLRALCWYPVLDVLDWGGLVSGRRLRPSRIAHSGLIRLDRAGRDLHRTVAADVVRAVRQQEGRLQRG